jgi:hypothetical protein
MDVTGVWDIDMRLEYENSTCNVGMGIINQIGVWSIDMLQGYGNSICDIGIGYRHEAWVREL